MIDPTHLRIGNLVQHKAEIITIDSIGDHAINILAAYPDGGIDWEWLCEEVEGIPLTPEWLERMGFVSYGNGIWGKNHDVQHYQIEKHPSNPDGYILFLDIHGVAAPPSVKIQTVHQLQNLYFALTSQELTIAK